MELLLFYLLFLCGQYVQALGPFLFSQTTLTTERLPLIPTSTESTVATATSTRKETVIDSQLDDDKRIGGQVFSKTRANSPTNEPLLTAHCQKPRLKPTILPYPHLHPL